MALVEKDKTNSTLVFLIVSCVVIGAVYLFSKFLSEQGEEKIALRDQNKENLSEYLVTGTGTKLEIPSIDSGSEQSAPEQSKVEKPTGTLPPMMLNDRISYKAIIETTAGKIEVELNAKETPITVNNFVVLAKKHFYDSTIFHRVIKGFMIQGGDPTGTGAGGPGYKFADEPFEGDYTRGTIAMANAGPNTNGSQFFIVHKDADLPKNYVIFGKVVDGMDTVDKIAEAAVTISSGGEKSKPVEPVKITSIKIEEKPVEN